MCYLNSIKVVMHQKDVKNKSWDACP